MIESYTKENIQTNKNKNKVLDTVMKNNASHSMPANSKI